MKFEPTAISAGFSDGGREFHRRHEILFCSERSLRQTHTASEITVKYAEITVKYSFKTHPYICPSVPGAAPLIQLKGLC